MRTYGVCGCVDVCGGGYGGEREKEREITQNKTTLSFSLCPGTTTRFCLVLGYRHGLPQEDGHIVVSARCTRSHPAPAPAPPPPPHHPPAGGQPVLPRVTRHNVSGRSQESEGRWATRACRGLTSWFVLSPSSFLRPRPPSPSSSLRPPSSAPPFRPPPFPPHPPPPPTRNESESVSDWPFSARGSFYRPGRTIHS